VARLNEAGIPCGVMVAPILPGITDRPEQLRDVVESAIAAGATHVSPILLHLRPGVKEEYLAWLEEHFPDLLPRYRSMYAGRAYAAKDDQRAATSAVSDLVARAGGLQPRPEVAERFTRGQRWRPRRGGDGEGSEQLTLL
jgi:DNA repair photolyase